MDDRRRDGGTNSTLRTKEQGKHLTLNEHDDDVNYSRRTPTRDLHMVFEIPYIYDFITKLCRRQAEVIQNHDNENVPNTGQDGAQHRNYKRLRLGRGQAYDRSSI